MRYLRPLRYVDAVARWGSIRRAADRLNVTPSAINRRIADLEAELGTALFERLPQGMRPTAAGELLLAHIRTREADLERVRSQIEELRGLRRGAVGLAASQAVAHRLVSAAVARFRAQSPLVQFRITVCDHATAMAMLAAYEVDLVLVVGPPRSSALLALTTVEQPLVGRTAAGRRPPADHPLAARATIRLRDLAGETLVLPDRSLAGRRLLEEALARRGLSARPMVECNSFDLLWQIVRSERAISIQFALGAPGGKGVAEGGLVVRPLDPVEVPAAEIVLGQLRERSLPVAAARFAEALAADLEVVAARS
jgi:DNA-binding transcriptional LysR family regulator